MRKRNAQPKAAADIEQWLDLASIAEVEITSECIDSPIESAIVPSQQGPGWRAVEPGKQVLRLIFDKPQAVKRIQLRFVEAEAERTQEFTLRWSNDGETYREIVRQQWNFAPMGATAEEEDYRVQLDQIRILELLISPDISHGNAVASLARLRVA